jgi:hypothetical protein
MGVVVQPWYWFVRASKTWWCNDDADCGENPRQKGHMFEQCSVVSIGSEESTRDPTAAKMSICIQVRKNVHRSGWSRPASQRIGRINVETFSRLTQAGGG